MESEAPLSIFATLIMNYNQNGADAAALAKNLVLNPASFHKLHEQQIRTMWKLKLLDAPAYILFIVQIHSAAGWKWSFKIKDFCKTWGIARRTFFRAVSQLRAASLLHWESDDTMTVWHGADIASIAPEETVSSVAPTPLDIGNYRVPRMAPSLPSVAPKTPETLAESESRQSSDSSQIFLKSTDNCAVAGEKSLTEEEEIDKAIDEVTDPPIIESRPTPLPTLEEVTQVESSIPQSEIIPLPQLNNDKVIKPNSNPVKKLSIEVELEEEVENKIEPTTEEVREVLQHLRGIGITLNHTIQAIVRKHYSSVSGAIAHLKERINSGERFRNIEGAFVKAVKEGAKPENKKSLGGIPQEINPPSIEQMAALEAARAVGKIRDFFLSTDGVCKVVMPNLHTQLPWWEYLK